MKSWCRTCARPGRNSFLVNRPNATAENLDQDVKTGLADLVPVGKMALANPDFVTRLPKKAPS